MSAPDFRADRLTGAILASGQVASPSTDATVYTVPTNCAVKITSASITNASGSAVTVSVAIVPAGGTVSNARKTLSSFPLAANDSLSLAWIVGAHLEAGAFISANAGTGAALNYLVTGLIAGPGS